jgi:hypothetical protein
MREFGDFLSCYYRAPDPGMIIRYEMLFYHMMWRMCCKLNYSATDGFVAWHPEKSGVFTIHSAYKFRIRQGLLEASSGHSSEAPNGEGSIWNLIWKCPMPPKLCVFTWRLATKSLSVKGSIHQRIYTICPLCE